MPEEMKLHCWPLVLVLVAVTQEANFDIPMAACGYWKIVGPGYEAVIHLFSVEILPAAAIARVAAAVAVVPILPTPGA